MITLYQWDEQLIYVGSIECDPAGRLPIRSTTQQPPELTGEQVAQWTGRGWQVLDEKPEPAIHAPTADDIAARRFVAETAGITLNGMHVETDDRSKLLINGAALEAMLDPDYVMQWKTPTGFVELDAGQVLGVATAARAHVQACFNREAELLDALAAGTFTPEMLDQGWP